MERSSIMKGMHYIVLLIIWLGAIGFTAVNLQIGCWTMFGSMAAMMICNFIDMVRLSR